MIRTAKNYDVLQSLKKWRNETPDRLKLQHVYLVLGIASVIVAGLIGLVNYAAGQRLVSFGLIGLGVYLINAAVWALVDGLLLIRIDRQDAVPAASPVKKTKKVTSTTRTIKK